MTDPGRLPALANLGLAALDLCGTLLFFVLARLAFLLPERSKAALFFRERGRNAWKLIEAKAQHQTSMLQTARATESQTRCYWFHVASAGEMEQIIPIARDLGEGRTLFLVISYTSPSAKPFLEKLPHQERCLAFALPLFGRRQVGQMLDAFAPDGLFFVRYDLWPALIAPTLERRIPLYLVGATRQLTRGGLTSWPSRQTKNLLLSAFDTIFAVEAADRDHFAQATKPRQVLLAGEPKWARAKERALAPTDPASPAATLREKIALERAKGRWPILILGSPHKDEWDIFGKLLRHETQGRGLTIIVAPHDVGESEMKRLARNLEGSGRLVLRLSEHLERVPHEAPTFEPQDDATLHLRPYNLLNLHSPLAAEGHVPADHEHRIWLLDVMGSLAEVYGLADLAIVGGGFDGGLHNCLEPAAQSLPVLFGSRHERAPEAKVLLEKGAALSFETPEEMFQFIRSCVSVGSDKSVSDWPAARLAQMALQAAELFKRVPDTSRVVREALDGTPALGSDRAGHG